ncbi:MAG: hypothetical protein S4CHLAM123_08010 [Chlamydiales bacterium]|nr:hypothetical protein [Chlamydiales bacterium]
MTVVTYGGGEILKNIFNAIAILMNSQSGSLLQPLMMITMSIGALWVVAKALFSSSGQIFLSQYAIPLIAIVGIFMVPTSSIHIEDILKDRSYKIDHVPFLLAKFAELASSVGYQITKAVEKTMHVPNDLSYNSTGMIFGADHAMDISRYQISNADLEKNLRMFCKQCVLYDLALGQYTIDEMKKTCDLWKFFEEKTSKVRMIRYQPVGSGDIKMGEYLSCRAAIKKMTPFFEKEKNYYGQLDVCRNLPLTFQAITNLQKDKEELISQQLVMNLLLDEYGSNNFAKGRAHLQQRNTYQTLGSLASSSLVTLRAVIEALVYAAFIFILPLSVLPGGLKYIMTWVGLVLWIQLWPPFYAILNYIMQSVSHGYADTIFNGLTGPYQGLSLFTSIGLDNLQSDIYALSGFLAASIPFITYAILKGGVGSFIHLASSMMSPAHSAASSAAAEQTSGNYSFGNTSIGQTSYHNTSGFQSNLAPSLSSGFFSENKGNSSAVYGQEEQIFKQSSSELRTSLFSDESISQSLQTSQMHAQSTAENAQSTYSESIASHSRNVADLSDHLTHSESYSNGLSSREAYDLQDSARYFQNVSENWGKQYGLSSRESMETLAGLGVNFVVQASATGTLGGNKEEALSSASNIIKSEEFQKHFQHLQDISSSDAYNSLDEKGMRMSESLSQSHENMESSQNSYQIAQSELNQISENATWSEQNSHLVRRSLNQDFVNWASDQFADQGGFAKVEEILTKGEAPTQDALISSFVDHVKSHLQPMESPSGFTDPHIAASHSLPDEVSSEKSQAAFQESLADYQSHFSTQLPEKKEELTDRYSQIRESNTDHFDQISSKIEGSRGEALRDFESESERPIVARALDQVTNLDEVFPIMETLRQQKNLTKWLPKDGMKPLASNFQITEEAFWMQKEEVQ